MLHLSRNEIESFFCWKKMVCWNYDIYVLTDVNYYEFVFPETTETLYVSVYNLNPDKI